MAMTFDEIQKLTQQQIFELKQKSEKDGILSDPVACTLLGQCYEFGTPHLAQNKKEARKLYKFGAGKKYEVASALFVKLSEELHIPVDCEPKEVQTTIMLHAKKGDSQHIFLEGFFRYYGLMGFSRNISGAKNILSTAKDHMPSKKLLAEIEKNHPSHSSSIDDKKEKADNTNSVPMDLTDNDHEANQMSMHNNSQQYSHAHAHAQRATAGHSFIQVHNSAVFSLLILSRMPAKGKSEDDASKTTSNGRPHKRSKS